jgi:hypothetical protein
MNKPDLDTPENAAKKETELASLKKLLKEGDTVFQAEVHEQAD